MVTATQGTGLDAARMEELRRKFLAEQQEAAFLERLKKEQEMAGKSGLGRLAQGMKGVGSRLAPAMQGAAAGAGFAASQAGVQTAKGLLAKPVSLLRNIIPENMAGWYVLLIMVVYVYSWMAGFAAPAVLAGHAILALIGFFMFVYVENSLEEGKGSLWQITRRNGATFSILLIIDYMLLTGQVQWTLVFIAALLLAFREGNPLEDLKRVAMVILIASVAFAEGPFLYNQFNRLFFTAAAKIALPLNFTVWSLNFGYLPFIIALLLNRTFTYPFFWFAIFGLSKKTRVARSLAWILMFLVIFAAWPTIAPEVSKLHSQYITGATAEEKAFWPNLVKQAGTNFKGAVGSLGSFFTVKTAYAYEKAEETFGFGTPKEEPKVGLQLFNDPTMPSEFDKRIREPSPSFLIKVPSPFPPDFKKKYLEVIGIECIDKTGNDVAVNLKKAVDEFNAGASGDKPLEVYYTGGRGGTTITCSQCGKVEGDVSCWESKSYTIEAKVNYRVEADSYLSTSFMKADELRNLRRQGLDPAVVEHTPIEKAEYSNVPVTLTWGPIGLVTSPAPVDFTTKQSNLAISIYVAKNSAWEGEIDGIEKLSLTVPDGVTLDTSKACAFEAVKGVPNKYGLKSDWIGKFIGEGKRFDCGINVSAAALHGLDWAPARFDVNGIFIFAAKKEGITFKVADSSAKKSSCTNPPACASGLTSCVASSCGASCSPGQTQCTSGTQVVCCGNPPPTQPSP